MRPLLQKAIYGLVIVGGITLLVVGFIAYFVRSIDIQNGIIYDGLGRQLTEAPTIARLFLTDEAAWPGWGWFFGDMVIFWGSIWVGSLLLGFAEKLDRPSRTKTARAS